MPRRGHNKARCKVCNLSSENKRLVDTMIEREDSLRKIARTLNENGIDISYGSIHRHRTAYKRKLAGPYKRYVMKRSRKRLTTQSLVMEKEMLSKLKQESTGHSVSLSVTVNYRLERWFEQRIAIPDFVDTLLKCRIRSGWLKDGRHKYGETERTSITLDVETKRRLQELLSDSWKYAMTSKMYKQFLEKHLTKKQLQQRYTSLQLYGLSEIINTILKLSLKSSDRVHANSR